MRTRTVLTLAVISALLVIPFGAAPAVADDDPVWSIEGAGWGHGVGMSQYGAYGMALDGFSVDDIIGHFYSGAYIDPLSNRSLPDWWEDSHPLVVGLEQDVTSVTIQAINGSAELCQRGFNSSHCVPETIPANATRTIKGDGDSCTVADGNSVSASRSCSIDVTWSDDGLTRVKVGSTEYAHGLVEIRPDGEAFNVTLDIELELYLRGIAEVPGTWPAAALEAQAVAARNYAVRRVLDTSSDTGDPTRPCGCHLMDGISDQVYAGWTKEGYSPNPWVTAVEATSGKVAVHPSTDLVFSAYYSSSSGGATENNESVWLGAPLQYLRSVEDPWSVSSEVGNPYSDWEFSFTSSALASIIGWDTVTSVELVANPPGATVRFSGVNDGVGVTKDYRGEALRTTFDLRSPWVDGVVSPYDFRDVSGSVHREAITFISDLGITKGCNPPANDRFCPDEPVTRGQMAAFLVRAQQLPDGDAESFSDMAGSVFDGDVKRLVAAGITRGCNPPDNDRFCADETVTRGQMAAFLTRAFGYTDAGTADFVDDNNSVFESDIERMAQAGVTKGCNPPANDRFCPDDPLTRAEMATFLMRALQSSG